MKGFLMLNLIFLFLLTSSQGQVKIIYLEEKPSEVQDMHFVRKEASNNYTRTEVLMKELEEDLIHYAKKNNARIIEIFVLQKENSEIPTESQVGKTGFIEILFALKEIKL